MTVSHGMDPSSYSFPYVAGWATETPDVEATLRDTGTRVLGAAHRILDRLDRDNPAPPVAEDAVPFELPSPSRATSVPAPPADGTGIPSLPLEPPAWPPRSGE